ncbi:1778_t:CDS:2, partial [Scutellospora calospora]
PTIYDLNNSLKLVTTSEESTNTDVFENLVTSFLAILSEIELLYMLPYQRRKHDWFPKLIFGLDKLNNIASKIQNNNWDYNIEMPFLSNALLEIIDKKKPKDAQISILIQKIGEMQKKLENILEKK